MSAQIEHVVVLMLENRSFDHMLGTLHQGWLPPLTLGDRVPRDPTRPGSEFVNVQWVDKYVDVSVDPGHGFDDVMKQLAGREQKGCWKQPYQLTNAGFVWNYACRRHQKTGRPPKDPAEIMRCYRQEDLPVLSTLAREYAVCTRWHCSLPSETWPNRLFAHAGTSYGAIKKERLIQETRTIFDLVEDAGQEAGVFFGDAPQTLTFGRPMARRIRHMSWFDDAVRAKQLPAYTFIEPRQFDSFGPANSQHPEGWHGVFHASGKVLPGEALIARIYETLRSVPEIWAKTLFLITYDEHGGFFDRAKPPTVRATGDVATNGFRFDLLGPRVPAVVVSPLVRPGTVEHGKTFDHTSIAATVRELFGIEETLSAREAEAETVTSLLTLDMARSSDETPDLTEFTEEIQVPPPTTEVEPELNEYQIDLLALMNEFDRLEGTEPPPEVDATLSVGERVAQFVERHFPPAP